MLVGASFFGNLAHALSFGIVCVADHAHGLSASAMSDRDVPLENPATGRLPSAAVQHCCVQKTECLKL